MADRDHRAPAFELRLGADARAVRRELGATAWVVLEDLLQDTGPSSGPLLRVETNVRRLAAHLGVSKDTAARALRRLLSAELIERDGGRGASGTFAPVAYTVRLDRLPGLSCGSTAMAKRPGREAPPCDTSQGTLFDGVAE